MKTRTDFPERGCDHNPEGFLNLCALKETCMGGAQFRDVIDTLKPENVYVGRRLLFLLNFTQNFHETWCYNENK